MSIGNKDFNFSYNEKLVATIKQLNFSQLVEFNQRLLMQRQFGELVLISAKNSKIKINPDWQLIPSVTNFKKRANYLS